MSTEKSANSSRIVLSGMQDIADALGMEVSTLRKRLKRGDPLGKIIKRDHTGKATCKARDIERYVDRLPSDSSRRS